jgi:hypothetical protein
MESLGIVDEHRPPLHEIFGIVSTRFGVAARELVGASPTVSGDPLNIPRNVAVVVALVAGYTREAISEYTRRPRNVIRQAIDRTRGNATRVRLAWGIWHSMGGRWDDFDMRLEPNYAEHIEMLSIPDLEEYALRGYSHLGDCGDVVPILSTFNRNMDVSPALMRHLGLDVKYPPERQLYSNLIKQTITDFLLGEDAKAWITIEEESNGDGISFSDCCTMLGLHPDALRSKLLRISELVKRTRELPPND